MLSNDSSLAKCGEDVKKDIKLEFLVLWHPAAAAVFQCIGMCPCVRE